MEIFLILYDHQNQQGTVRNWLAPIGRKGKRSGKSNNLTE